MEFTMIGLFRIDYGLLGEAAPYMNMGDRFRDDHSGDNASMLIGSVVAIALFVAISYVTYRLVEARRRRQLTSPSALFRQLCHAHQLQRSERRLLLRQSAARELSHPAILFIDPDHLHDRALSDWDEKERDQLRQVRRRLFGKRKSASRAVPHMETASAASGGVQPAPRA